MALYQSDLAKGYGKIVRPQIAGVVTAQRFTVAIPASGLSVGDIFEFVNLPGGCNLVDWIFDQDQLDSHGTPTGAFDLGLMSGAFGDPDQARTSSNELRAAQVTTNAAQVLRPEAKSQFVIGASNVDRSIGFKLTTLPATAVAGSIGLTTFITSA